MRDSSESFGTSGTVGSSDFTLLDLSDIASLDPTNAARSCFEADTSYLFGLAWGLDVDHANEIQTDSVAFDLGFYAEQCRHNDGAGDATGGLGTEELDLSTGVANWQVVSSPDGKTGDAVASGKHPAWATVDVPECSAQWVDPYGNAPTDSDPVGEYVYELEFEIPTPSPRDLVVYAFGSDNPGRLLLDGTAAQSHQVSNAFDPLNETVVTVEDVPVGTHTLTAEVENLSGSGQNPTGLFVCAALE